MSKERNIFQQPNFDSTKARDANVGQPQEDFRLQTVSEATAIPGYGGRTESYSINSTIGSKGEVGIRGQGIMPHDNPFVPIIKVSRWNFH